MMPPPALLFREASACVCVKRILSGCDLSHAGQRYRSEAEDQRPSCRYSDSSVGLTQASLAHAARRRETRRAHHGSARGSVMREEEVEWVQEAFSSGRAAILRLVTDHSIHDCGKAAGITGGAWWRFENGDSITAYRAETLYKVLLRLQKGESLGEGPSAERPRRRSWSKTRRRSGRAMRSPSDRGRQSDEPQSRRPGQDGPHLGFDHRARDPRGRAQRASPAHPRSRRSASRGGAAMTAETYESQRKHRPHAPVGRPRTPPRARPSGVGCGHGDAPKRAGSPPSSPPMTAP